jgi:hypothetical protein
VVFWLTTLSLRGTKGRGNPSCLEVRVSGFISSVLCAQWIATGCALAMTCKGEEISVVFWLTTLSLRGTKGRGNPWCLEVRVSGFIGSVLCAQWIAMGESPRDDKGGN